MENTGLFGQRLDLMGDTQLLLLEKMLADLPQKKKIEMITLAILDSILPAYHKETPDEKVIPFLGALEAIFKEKADFRAHLMKNIYPYLYCRKVGYVDHFQFVPAMPKFQLAVLNKILHGWLTDVKGGEECFLFICDAYKSTEDQTKTIKNGILEIFRTHLEQRYFKSATELDPWILYKNIPLEIIEVLLKARAKKGGGTLGLTEIHFLQHFKPCERTKKAIEIANLYLDKIMLIETLAMKFIVAMGANGIFRLDEPINTGSKKIDYHLLSENVAKLSITLAPRWQFDTVDCPQILSEILSVREKLFRGIENPPKLILEVSGPNGFHYNEDE